MAAKTKKAKDPRPAELRALGERIREQRNHRKVTQQSLAQELGLSIAYVSLIECGRRNPPYSRVVAIARALRVPAAKLVE
jgi:transcriptional regulator with XRE-family HTH domain